MRRIIFSIVFCSFLMIKNAFASETCTPEETNCWSCGSNCIARLYPETGKFVVSGTGEMDNYTPKKRAPWYNVLSSIYEVDIQEGITSVGNFSFEGPENANIKSIHIGDTVKVIGEAAFFRTRSVSEIYLPESLEVIKQQAFEGDRPLKSFVIPQNTYFPLGPDPKTTPFNGWNLSVLYCPETLKKKCIDTMKVINNTQTKIKTYRREDNVYVVDMKRYHTLSEMQNQE